VKSEQFLGLLAQVATPAGIEHDFHGCGTITFRASGSETGPAGRWNMGLNASPRAVTPIDATMD
jgi:hypothetical protein